MKNFIFVHFTAFAATAIVIVVALVINLGRYYRKNRAWKELFLLKNNITRQVLNPLVLRAAVWSAMVIVDSLPDHFHGGKLVKGNRCAVFLKQYIGDDLFKNSIAMFRSERAYGADLPLLKKELNYDKYIGIYYELIGYYF
jgi:hypothetical protein